MVTVSDFKADSHASKYLSAFPPGLLEHILELVYEVDSHGGFPRVQRMKDAELHFDLPAFAGLIKDLESDPLVSAFFAARTVKDSQHFRQAMGVLVKLIMENEGWATTGTKGHLGRRTSSYKPGGPYNSSRSLSKFFTQSERYICP